MTANLRERRVWRVSVPEHQIDRWLIPESTEEVQLSFQGSADVERPVAVTEACIRVHVRHGLPPWNPYLRQTVDQVTAEQVTV